MSPAICPKCNGKGWIMAGVRKLLMECSNCMGTGEA